MAGDVSSNVALELNLAPTQAMARLQSLGGSQIRYAVLGLQTGVSLYQRLRIRDLASANYLIVFFDSSPFFPSPSSSVKSISCALHNSP